MHRSRASLFAAFSFGALFVAVALPMAVAGCQHGAADAQAASLAAATPAPAPAPDRQLGTMPSLAPLVRQLRPVVVNIASRFKPHVARAGNGRASRAHPRIAPPPQGPDDEQQDPQQPEDPMERFFRYFGGRGGPQQPDEQERRGLGSGFYIGDGLVLTNNHVVEVQDEQGGKFRAMDEITVKTDETAPGGAREYSAKVIGADDKSDVALLKLDGPGVKELKAAALGDSDALEVGDYVLAIGEPFGLQATVTSGIISAKERSQFGGPYSDYLQTDASINPGNSGGPLFNLKGEVVGINAAIISGANTIGFAIPINVIKQILPQLREKGRVVRGFLGVAPQGITQDMVEQLGLKDSRGALVADVVKDGPAEKAGLKAGDVIVALNGHPINDNNQLTRDVGAVQPGNSVKLQVIRGGKEQNVDVKVADRPEDRPDKSGASADRGGNDQGQGDLLGLTVENLTPEMAQRARIAPGSSGVIVTDVAPDSPGANAGIDAGDLVIEVNRQPVASVADYRKAVKGIKKGDTALVRVRSGPAVRYVPLRVR